MKNTKLLVLAATVGLFQISCDRTSSTKNGGDASSTNSNSGTAIEVGTMSGGSNPEYKNRDLQDGNYYGSFRVDEDSYSSVYSSQNYGTFYQFYCKPKLYTDNGVEYIESLEFRLINYKGPINIGFTKDNAAKHVWGYKDGILGLKIIVKGSGKNNTMILNVKDKKIKKGEFVAMNIYRELVPLAGAGDQYRTASVPSGQFDSEFFTRSGLGEPIKKKLVPGLWGYPSTEPGGFDIDNFTSVEPAGDFQMLAEGKNCYSSLLTVNW